MGCAAILCRAPTGAEQRACAQPSSRPGRALVTSVGPSQRRRHLLSLCGCGRRWYARGLLAGLLSSELQLGAEAPHQCLLGGGQRACGRSCGVGRALRRHDVPDSWQHAAGGAAVAEHAMMLPGLLSAGHPARASTGCAPAGQTLRCSLGQRCRADRDAHDSMARVRLAGSPVSIQALARQSHACCAAQGAGVGLHGRHLLG